MKVLLYASGSSFVAFIIGTSLIHDMRAGFIAAALWFLSAMVGASVFWTTKRCCGPNPSLSAVMSGMGIVGLLAAAVILLVDYIYSILAVFLMIVIAVAALITITPAIIFGYGIGQAKREEQT